MNPEEHCTTDKPKKKWNVRIHEQVKRARKFIREDIWESDSLEKKDLRARFHLFARILVITFEGLKRNNLPLQSAALTFYSLIGIGPLIALGIMISGFILDQPEKSPSDLNQPAENRGVDVVTEVITKAIAYAAPKLTLAADEEIDSSSLAPEITEMVNNFIDAAQSGTVGIIGSLTLFIIGIQVLASIERSFNSLWGVKKGRKIGERIIVYWTFISMGAIIGTASLTLVTISRIAKIIERLPFGGEFFSLVLFLSPLIVLILIIFLLAAFFRFIPNTRVEWKAAFIGASIVIALLQVYNMLSFIYVQRVVDTRSLYGSVGIIVVLMLGLNIFWLLILFGGQVTYAVQNANHLTNESVWQKISIQTQELISLAILVLVAKQFQMKGAPARFNKLLKKLRIPSHVLNSSIDRLCQLGYLVPVVISSIEDTHDPAYQPGCPLESINLGTFRKAFQSQGNNEGFELIARSIPEVNVYVNEIIGLKNCPEKSLTINELIRT